MDKLINSVNLLGAFSVESDFKYLTHRFDAESDDFIDTVNRCRNFLLECKDRIPSHLYKLLFGFLFGLNWIDSNGKTHSDFCGCDKWIDWCLDNPGVHPMDAFYEEFEAFKNSIRIYNGTFDDSVRLIKESNGFNNIVIRPDYPSLGLLDCYVDVGELKRAIIAILKDINSYHNVSSFPDVQITCSQGEVLIEKTNTELLYITHLGSSSKRSIEDAVSHFNIGGGFISDLRKILEDVALLSIETNWNGCPRRWNVIKMEGQSDIEEIPGQSINGFTYIIKILHKS